MFLKEEELCEYMVLNHVEKDKFHQIILSEIIIQRNQVSLQV